MFCINCGTQLPDGANFCFKCGKPQGQDSPAQEQKSEMCEIIWEETDSLLNTILNSALFFNRRTGQFVAKAIGPKGVYVAGRTQIFSGSDDVILHEHDNTTKQMLNALIAKLGKDGWEPVETKSGAWFGYRFRRNIKV